MKPQSRSIRLHPLIAVILCGIVIRLIYFRQHLSSPYYEPILLDPAYYQTWALRILRGDWIHKEAFYGLPLYPMFLAATYKIFGTHIASAKLIQQLMGAIHIALIYLLTQRLFGRRSVAIIASLLAAVYAPYLFHELILIPEPLTLVLYTASLLMCLELWSRPSLKKAALTGSLIALSGCGKAGIFLFALFFVIVFVWKHPQKLGSRAGQILVLVFTLLLTVSPLTVHNWLTSHDFVPLSWHGGLNFYIGNNPSSEGIFKTPTGVRSNIDGQIQDSRMIAERVLNRRLRPSEISGFWYREGFRFIREKPLEAAILWLKKAGLFINYREISDVQDITFSQRFSPILRFLIFDFLLLFTLAIPGFFYGFKILQKDHRLIVLLWILTYAAAVIAFFVNARYRIPLVSALMPFAAFGLYRAFGIFQAKRGREIATLTVLAAVAFAFCRMDLAEPNPALQLTNVGNIYMKSHQWNRAIEYYKEAIRLNPSYAKAYNDLGVAYRETGRLKEAARSFKETIAQDPSNPFAYNNLGLLLDRQGAIEEAERLFRKAVAVQPNLAEAHNNLGMITAKKGDFNKAEEYFKRALSLNPRSPRALTNLGLIYFYRGDTEEARQAWNKALQIDPHFEDAQKALKGLILRRPAST